MGLDIYLRKCPDLAAATAAENARDAEVEALWAAAGGYDSLTEEQRKELRAEADEISKKHGCTGMWGHHASITEYDEQNSAIDPEHMFRIGYFRSSYNEGGIERIMRKLGLPGLHDIFQQNDEYDFAPDWNAALARCNDAITRYEAHLASPTGKYSVMELRPMYEYGVGSEKEALDLFSKEVLLKGKERPYDGGWINRDGEFFPSGMKVCAFITKTFKPPHPGSLIGSVLNQPTVFVVYEKESDDKPDWYLTALKIVRETIEYVLAQPDREHFYLVWSG